MEVNDYARVLLAKAFPTLSEGKLKQLEEENHRVWQEAYQRAQQDEMNRPCRCRP